MSNDSMKKTPYFINKPITESDSDFLGSSFYAEILDGAINEGARMIAITSPYGTGKTSVIELLRKKHNNVHIVSLWPKLIDIKRKQGLSNGETGKSVDDELIDLHKYLICYIAKECKSPKLKFIEGKLNPKYGILRVMFEDECNQLLFTIGFALLISSMIIEKAKIHFITEYDSLLCFVMGLFIIIYIVLSSEVVFSSKNSENNRNVEPYQFATIFDDCVLQTLNETHYIVIDDLDRLNDYDLVVGLIKEIKKYYTSYSNKTDKIVFIFNINNESQIKKIIIDSQPNNGNDGQNSPKTQKEPANNQGENNNKDNDGAITNKEKNDRENDIKQFPKLFDYIINFPKVNIDNFDYFTKSLLQNHKDEIFKLIGEKNDLSLDSIDGGQWLIKGKNVDIRQIKDRLNKFFALYNVLESKFPGKISIKKCVGAVYLQSEYEKEFYSAKDSSIDFIINSYLSPDNEDFKEGIKGLEKNFIDAVLELYKAQLIGTDYRIYFYNYPIGDTVYDYYENIVFDAIFNNIPNDNLDLAIKNCKKLDVFINSFKKYSKLGIPLKNVVINNETLLLKAFDTIPDSLFLYIDWLCTEEKGIEKSVEELTKIIKTCSLSEQYERSIEKFINYIDKLEAEKISILLEKLSEIDTAQIKKYLVLFKKDKIDITKNEIEAMNINDLIFIKNQCGHPCTPEQLHAIIDKAEKMKNEIDDNSKEILKGMIDKLLEKEAGNIKGSALIQYMCIISNTIEEYESHLVNQFVGNKDLFESYQNLVNSLDLDKIEQHTLDIIGEHCKFSGYKIELSQKYVGDENLFKKSMIEISNGIEIDLLNAKLKEELLNNIPKIYKNDRELFDKIRIACISKNVIKEYSLLFGKEYGILNKAEFKLMVDKYGIESSLPYILNELIKDENDYIFEIINDNVPKNREGVFNVLDTIIKWSNADKFLEKIDIDNKYSIKILDESEQEQLFNDYITKANNNSIESKIRICKIFNYLFSGFDKDIPNLIASDPNIENSYKELLKLVDTNSITSTTINNISNLKEAGYTDDIEKKLWSCKEYKLYIISKTIRLGVFNYEKIPEKNWEIYADIINTCPNTATIISKNDEFIKKFIDNGGYKHVKQEKFDYLLNVPQSKKIIEYVANKNDDSINSYLIKIKAFDSEQAESFVCDFVIKGETVSKDRKIIDHIAKIVEFDKNKKTINKLMSKVDTEK